MLTEVDEQKGLIKLNDNNIDVRNVVIRQGMCNIYDAGCYAELSGIASDGMYEILYGNKWNELQMLLYMKMDTTDSYLRTWFACVDDRIIGVITCYDYNDSVRCGINNQKYIKNWLGCCYICRYFCIVGCCGNNNDYDFLNNIIHDDEMYIETIAIYEQFRRQGIGCMLLKSAEKNARKLGCKYVVVNVLKTNRNGIQFYRKNEFKVFKDESSNKTWKMKKLLL